MDLLTIVVIFGGGLLCALIWGYCLWANSPKR